MVQSPENLPTSIAEPAFRLDQQLHQILYKSPRRRQFARMVRWLPVSPCILPTRDWGVVGDHKFDVNQLDEMKKECTKHCLSTCNYILRYRYDNMRVITWGLKQAMNGFRGATRSF